MINIHDGISILPLVAEKPVLNPFNRISLYDMINSHIEREGESELEISPNSCSFYCSIWVIDACNRLAATSIIHSKQLDFSYQFMSSPDFAQKSHITEPFGMSEIRWNIQLN